MQISVSQSNAPAAPVIDPATPPPGAPEAMAKTVGRGATWMVMASLGGKGLAFIAQIILGWWLSTGDYAVFGVALALSGLMAIFKDGGVREVLVQKGHAEYKELVGPVFWLATWMNVFAAFLMCIAALVLAFLQKSYPQLLSDSYRNSMLPWMLIVIGAAVPLQSPAAVLLARLRLDLRFGEISKISMWSALLRNASLVAAAYWLRNPLAFVIPMAVVAIYEGIAAYQVTGESPWKFPAAVKKWKGLLSLGGWMILQAAAGILFDLASFAVIGLILPQDAVGNYVFAYNWITQTQTLLGFALLQVLFPALSRLKDDLDRFRAAVIRAQHVQMMLGAVASLGLAVIMKPLESMIWGGKWADCVSVVMILGVFFPFRVTLGLSTAVMMARGHFRSLSLISVGEGILVVSAAAAGAIIGKSADAVAYGVGLALLIGRVIATWLALRDLKITMWGVIKGMFPSWLVSLVAAGIALGFVTRFQVDPWMHEHLHALLHSVITSEKLLGKVGDLAMICLIGGIFSFVMAVLSRILLRSSVEDVCTVLPVRLGLIARRLMFLPKPA